MLNLNVQEQQNIFKVNKTQQSYLFSANKLSDVSQLRQSLLSLSEINISIYHCNVRLFIDCHLSSYIIAIMDYHNLLVVIIS